MQARSARRLLPRPQVVEGELEPGACLWCYCCSEEVGRHRTDREVTVVWGGMLEHMGRWVEGEGQDGWGGVRTCLEWLHLHRQPVVHRLVGSACPLGGGWGEPLGRGVGKSADVLLWDPL